MNQIHIPSLPIHFCHAKNSCHTLYRSHQQCYPVTHLISHSISVILIQITIFIMIRIFKFYYVVDSIIC